MVKIRRPIYNRCWCFPKFSPFFFSSFKRKPKIKGGTRNYTSYPQNDYLINRGSTYLWDFQNFPHPFSYFFLLFPVPVSSSTPHSFREVQRTLAQKYTVYHACASLVEATNPASTPSALEPHHYSPFFRVFANPPPSPTIPDIAKFP